MITLAFLKEDSPRKVSTQKTGVGRRDQGGRGVSRQGGGGDVRSSRPIGFENLIPRDRSKTKKDDPSQHKSQKQKKWRTHHVVSGRTVRLQAGTPHLC